MSVKAQVSAEINATETGAPTIGSASASLALGTAISFANGTGAGKADLVYAAARSIAATSSENLDLAGVLTDAFGALITAAKVKAVLIVADAGNVADLVVGAAGSNPFLGPLGGTTPTASVRPGGILLFADPGLGWTVTAGTGDILKVANGGAATAAYRIEIVAASA